VKRHEAPMTTTPIGKPSVKARLTATPCGTLPIHTGHGKEIGPTVAPTSFPGKGYKSGATSKGKLTIHTGHGTEIGPTTSRG
jgi:hypothetical protein